MLLSESFYNNKKVLQAKFRILSLFLMLLYKFEVKLEQKRNFDQFLIKVKNPLFSKFKKILLKRFSMAEASRKQRTTIYILDIRGVTWSHKSFKGWIFWKDFWRPEMVFPLKKNGGFIFVFQGKTIEAFLNIF